MVSGATKWPNRVVAAIFWGGVAEWLKATVLKTVILIYRDRGFESLLLRLSRSDRRDRLLGQVPLAGAFSVL